MRRAGTPLARLFIVPIERRSHMSNYAGRSQEERIAQRKGSQPRSQEQPGGTMAERGTEPDKDNSSGQLTEEGKQVWRTGSGIDGGGKT
jgi:hypothetical protein